MKKRGSRIKVSGSQDPHFRHFALSLETSIARLSQDDDEAFLAKQKRQVTDLLRLERQFRKELCAHSCGEAVYRAFISHILDERGNILDARPYFRERQERFTAEISNALRERKVRVLQRFSFNYRFISWVLESFEWAPKSKVSVLGRQIQDVREQLVVMNLPLAISRASQFFARTPRAHLSRMDLIQIAAEGLMAGIDKFVGPYSKMFRGVAIGRMGGNMIENYSETLVHFYPRFKRILYRINKAASRMQGPIDFQALTSIVNEGTKSKNKEAAPLVGSARTNPEEVADLMAAASVVSTDALPDVRDSSSRQRVSDRYAAPAASQPDVQYEEAEAFAAMKSAIPVLPLRKRKVLRMRGVEL